MPVTLRPVLAEPALSSSRTWRTLAYTAAPSPSARQNRLKVSWTWVLRSGWKYLRARTASTLLSSIR